jgi:hypothetical protein
LNFLFFLIYLFKITEFKELLVLEEERKKSDEESEEEDSEYSEEEYSDSEDEVMPRLKPVFVKK